MSLLLADHPLSRPGALAARVDLKVAAAVGIQRQERRGRCVVCGTRRVLYRVIVHMADWFSHSEARCRECWGMTA